MFFRKSDKIGQVIDQACARLGLSTEENLKADAKRWTIHVGRGRECPLPDAALVVGEVLESGAAVGLARV